MTIVIADNSPRKVYDGNGSTTEFATDFAFFDKSDVNVYVDGTLKTLNTDYTIPETGANAWSTGNDGTVVFTTAPANGTKVVLTRDVELERTTDFPSSGPFQVATLNTELDKIVAMIADLEDLASRGITLADSDTGTTASLPDVTARKGRVLAFENDATAAPKAGPLITDVQSVADVSADIATLADIEDGTDATDAISDLAAVASDVSTAASNITEIQNASANATTATTKATEAAASATAAAASATAAAASETAAETAETNAETAETNAATSATNAATSATSAASSATTATTKASEASTSATNAATSATSASTAQTAAETAQTAAETAKTAAETAKTGAETAQTAAETAQTAAETAETNAATSETNAATSATTATTKASEAATSATNAATSETNAATSATNAATSATAAAASQTAAAASAASAASAYDSFDDRYLGVKTSDPTLDNDSNALVEGALYFNSTANEMRVYDGANWIAASSAGSVSLLNYNYTATAGQTTFSGADEDSNTLSYTVSNLIVTLNGVVLEDGTDYTATSGTSVVLTSGAALNDELNIIAFKSFTTADMVSATNGGTFANDITINGDLTVDTNTLHVDSTNNRVGIGLSSPDRLLTLQGDNSYMWIKDAGGGNTAFIGSDGTNDGWLRLYDSSHNTKVEIESDGVTYFNGGNVGIGTSSPSSKTSIIGTGVNGLHLGQQTDNNGNSARLFYDNSTNIWTTYSTAGSFKIASGATIGTTSGTDRLVINSSGNVGIGTSSPGYPLTVAGSADATIAVIADTNDSSIINLGDTSNGVVGRIEYDHSDNSMRLHTAATERMRIASSGAVSIAASSGNGYLSVQQAYNGTTSSAVNMHILSNGNFLRSTSSGRYKTDIEDAEMSYAEELYNLRPIYFRSLCTVDNPEHSHWGFVAEEVAEIDPRLCFFKTKEVVLDDEGNQTFDDDGVLVETELEEPIVEGVQYDRMIPLLLMLLKAEKDKVETLQTKVTTLETENADFETRIAALEAN